MYSKQQLITILSNISFVCVDEPDERDRHFIDMANERPHDALEWLRMNQARWPSSKGTIEWIAKYEAGPNYESFHIAAHFLTIDKIINFLQTGEGLNMEMAIEHALNCGSVTKDVLDSLLFYARNEVVQKVA